MARIEIIDGICYGPFSRQRLDILKPQRECDRNGAAIVYLHGGGWRSGTRKSGIPYLKTLAMRGFTCFSIDYVFSTEARFPAQIIDVFTALDYIYNCFNSNVNPLRVGIWGHSSGGHLAALAGTLSTSKNNLPTFIKLPSHKFIIQSVCCFAPLSDFSIIDHKHYDTSIITELIGGNVYEKSKIADFANPIHYISRNSPSFLIIHGSKDKDVPVSQSWLLHQALVNAGAHSQFVKIPNVGHHPDALIRQGAGNLVANFFTQTLNSIF